MFSISLRKQCRSTLIRYFVLSKLSNSSGEIIQVEKHFKIKEFCEDFGWNKIKKNEFKKFFIENLFINKFQEKILEYPELNFLPQVESLKKQSYLVQQLLDSTNDKVKTLCNDIVENSVNTLRTHEFTGFKVSHEENGFGYVNSEFSFFQEALGVSPSLAKSVCENETFGAHLINLYGNNTQKEEYLKKLSKGEIIASFAHLETEPFAILDPDLINAEAKLSLDYQNYIVSGKKKWVYNAKNADIFILTAKVTTDKEVKEIKPTLFLIHKSLPGVKVHEPINTVGLKKLNICDVTFDEVVVPFSCVLGGVHEGGSIVREIMSNGKLSTGAHCLPIMRKLVNMTIKHCIKNSFFNRNKFEKDCYKVKIGQIVSQIYAVESMTYLVTGRSDQFLNPDIFLESLIVKIFASENLRSVLQMCTEIVGHEVLISESNWKEIIRDAHFYAASDITNDHLRLLLSITGVQHAMDHEEKKNFFKRKASDAMFKLNKFILRDRESEIVSKGVLQGYLHSIFKQESRGLEDGVAWLSESTTHLIKTYGKNVFEKYFELKMLADIVIYVYAETAVLGRASRAYCIGVELSEVDRCIASAIIACYHHRINKLGLLLKNYKYSSFDSGDKQIVDCNGYSELCSVIKNLTIRN